MYLINYVFGEVKIDCLNEVSKNVRVLGILTKVGLIFYKSRVGKPTVLTVGVCQIPNSRRNNFYLLTAGATQRILEYRKKCR